MKARQRIVRELKSMTSHLEDIWAEIAMFDRSIGDDGVAELLIDIENKIQLAIRKVDSATNTRTN